MKKILLEVIVIVSLLSSFLDASANPETNKIYHKAVPTKGFWVITETVANKQLVTVLYYNSENHLVRKETRTKQNADISCKRVVRSLKRSLEEAID